MEISIGHRNEQTEHSDALNARTSFTVVAS